MHMLSIRKITVLRGMVWSSGQRACLIFRRSEFESRLRRHLFSDIVSEKNEYNKKGSGFAHFEKMTVMARSNIMWQQFSLLIAFPLCESPYQPGKGQWIAEDRFFGHGLNIPRTRHASEIIKTVVSPALLFCFQDSVQ